MSRVGSPFLLGVFLLFTSLMGFSDALLMPLGGSPSTLRPMTPLVVLAVLVGVILLVILACAFCCCCCRDCFLCCRARAQKKMDKVSRSGSRSQTIITADDSDNRNYTNKEQPQDEPYDDADKDFVKEGHEDSVQDDEFQ